MATTYKVLGQSAPSATTATDLYTVPASTSTVCSTLVVCNRGSSDETFRISVRPAGAAQANQHYLYYDVTLESKTTATFTLGLTLATTDIITVYASTADFSFSLFGSEIS